MFRKNILISCGKVLLNEKLDVLNGLLCLVGFLLKDIMLILKFAAYVDFLKLVDTFSLTVLLLRDLEHVWFHLSY
jgi:hypothetical protein